MARTLPWLKSGTTTTLQSVRPKPAKRQRMLDPDSDSDDNVNSRAVANTKNQAALTAERTPSTSPPPQPPTEEFMRPGLSADDIYIMVEDEFHAVAQTFTKHLHHAEYIRLRNVAKERNASTITNISRPVDSITTMREETRKKKEAEAREMKMKAAIESIKAPKRAKGPFDESDISDFEDDRQDDPWQGTQLQRFITASPKKHITGLTGLQGVVSHTRAAAGYSKPEKRPPQPTRLFESAHPYNGATTTNIAQAVADSPSDTDDDDDLDAPSRLPSHPPPRMPSRPPMTATKPTPSPVPSRDLSERTAPISSPAKPLQRAFLDMTPRTVPTTSTSSSSNPSKQPKPPGPSPPVKHEPKQGQRSSISEVRQRMKARREREEMEKRKKSSSGIDIDEIPVFLV